MSQGNGPKHECVEDNTACVSQSDMARHVGAESVKLACCKVMWLGTKVPKATQSSHAARQCV
ncbi:unnamed protein product [Prunus armeniaca]